MKKYLSILFFVLLALVLASCTTPKEKDKDKIPDTPEVTVESVKLTNDGIYAFDYNDFFLSDMKVVVKYSDATEKIIPVTRDMISTEDFEKMLVAGDHVITVRYLEKELSCVLILNATAGNQSRMGSVVLYSITTEEESTITYEFFLAGTGNCVTFDLSYENLAGLGQLTLIEEESLPGAFLANTSTNKIRLMYSHGESIDTHSSVFVFTYAGELKEFAENATLSYSFYDYVTEVFLVQNVRIVYR